MSDFLEHMNSHTEEERKSEAERINAMMKSEANIDGHEEFSSANSDYLPCDFGIPTPLPQTQCTPPHAPHDLNRKGKGSASASMDAAMLLCSMAKVRKEKHQLQDPEINSSAEALAQARISPATKVQSSVGETKITNPPTISPETRMKPQVQPKTQSMEEEVAEEPSSRFRSFSGLVCDLNIFIQGCLFGSHTFQPFCRLAALVELAKLPFVQLVLLVGQLQLKVHEEQA
jgi:hypothetical protein